MSLKSLSIASVYNPGVDGADVLEEFFEPALSCSLRYDRVSGYFSSSVFASAARGVAGLVANGGKMRLVTSHSFTGADLSGLDALYSDAEFGRSLIEAFESSIAQINSLGSVMEKNHFSAMCWMLANGYLEVKVIVPKKADGPSISSADLEKFHPKFGVLSDEEGDVVAFSGSVNETTFGWTRNVENITVFKSWEPGQSTFIDPFERLFQRYWAGQNLGDWICIDLPEAVKEKIANDYAPDDFPASLRSVPKDASEATSELRAYQQEAVDFWVGRGHTGLLEMATGSGKTRTARKCIDAAQAEGPLLTVVVVPYQHIADQWVKELSGHNVFQVQSSSNWRRRMEDATTSAILGRLEHQVIVVVKNTASSADFSNALSRMKESFANLLLIGDEVHWLGAPSFQGALYDFADFRLGLSATPRRYFDEEGSAVLREYFDSPPNYTFSLADALAWRLPDGSTVLCPYFYHPRFVELVPDEDAKYSLISKRIAHLLSEDPSPEQKNEIEQLRIRRAMIAKKAENKIPELDRLIEELGADLKQCLIYCAETSQLEAVATLLSAHKIDFQKITGAEGANRETKYGNRSEREFIIENFAAGELNVLLAMDCLDEGVDIPSAQMGIILASSGNEKEFIQRRGRLMRRFSGKNFATIYDFVVLPGPQSPESEDAPLGFGPPANLREVEIRRILEFAADAANETEIKESISHLLEIGK